jgi:DNA-binding transcriptional MerR regulator
MDSPQGQWSTYDVCELTGASYRQVDYWTRTTPVFARHTTGGSGSRRRWTDEEVQRIDLMVRCRRAQLDLDTVRDMAQGEVGSPVLASMAPSVSIMVEWRTIDEIEATAVVHREPVHVSPRSYRRPGQS